MRQAATQALSAPPVQIAAPQEGARYAIYYSPLPNHPLRQAAASWLERDASTATDHGAQGCYDSERLPVISEPRRYGFHATLKPPFRLAPGQSLSDLKNALESFSLTNWPCPLGPMRIEVVRGFFALVPRAVTPRIRAFASAIVEDLDGFRAPFDAGEMHRRLADGLDDDEATNLVRWGYSLRLRLMMKEMRDLAPDVVLLQECFAAPSLDIDTAASLADTLQFYKATWPGREKVRLCEGEEAMSTSGLAVLSRYPILSSRSLPLPSDARDGERAALITEIDHPGGLLVAVDLHLTHLADGDELRRRQFACVMGELARMPSTMTVIVGGDFNDSLDAGFGEFELPNGRLMDCRKLVGLDPSPTSANGNFCIDHVLFLAGKQSSFTKVLGVSTVFDKKDPVTGVLPSDHFGVSVSLG